ncbi:MAG: helix-turn-helix transcriptional regulator [Rhodobacteraceae bacterium]|nr:helix-turn-helix transcriptional regulator [Paracoccaceae bacterium]
MPSRPRHAAPVRLKLLDGGQAATQPRAAASKPVAAARITQARTARFADLCFTDALAVFVEHGEKIVLQSQAQDPETQDLRAGPGDAILFAPGALFTIENRVWGEADYAATVIRYPDAALREVFGAAENRTAPQVQQIQASVLGASFGLDGVKRAMNDPDLPENVLQHRLIEPLLWLKAAGAVARPAALKSARAQIQGLIEREPSHPWRAQEIAERLAVSEATLRRQLSRTGDSFSKILRNTRLEQGLALLQTTEESITEIALTCGFATPSHFSQAFRQRFGCMPKAIRSRED